MGKASEKATSKSSATRVKQRGLLRQGIIDEAKECAKRVLQDTTLPTLSHHLFRGHSTFIFVATALCYAMLCYAMLGLGY